MKVYLPNYESTNCAIIYNSDTIRVYDTVPTNNSTVNYKDYFIKSDYYFNTGSQTFSQYSTLPTCISSSDITTDYYYRVDFMNILVIFFIISIFSFLIPWKIFIRMFRRYQ